MPERTVEVWNVRLNASEELVEWGEGTLSSDERERTRRFRFQHLRTRFVLGRAVLRALIGSYLNCASESLVFTCGAQGKLALPGAHLQFNLSHSGDFAAYAFTSKCPVGIDIEQLRAVPDAAAIAQRFFSREERLELLSLPREQIDAAFFRCWTRKEAYIKAIGSGLSTPLDSFRVSLSPGAPAALVSLSGDYNEASAWTISDFRPAPGYTGALAFRHPGHEVRLLPPASAAEILRRGRSPKG